MLRQRPLKVKPATPQATQPSTPSSRIGSLSKSGYGTTMDGVDNPRLPLLGSKDEGAPSEPHLSTLSISQDREENDAKQMENLSRKSQWIILALASGACASFNGVFAKL
jgi:hypothetical protein